MTRRTIGLLVTLALGFVAGSLAVEAPPPGTIHRTGVLRLASPPDPAVEGFRQGLRDLGYREGQNLVIESRSAVRRAGFL